MRIKKLCSYSNAGVRPSPIIAGRCATLWVIIMCTKQVHKLQDTSNVTFLLAKGASSGPACTMVSSRLLFLHSSYIPCFPRPLPYFPRPRLTPRRGSCFPLTSPDCFCPSNSELKQRSLTEFDEIADVLWLIGEFFFFIIDVRINILPSINTDRQT